MYTEWCRLRRGVSKNHQQQSEDDCTVLSLIDGGYDIIQDLECG